MSNLFPQTDVNQPKRFPSPRYITSLDWQFIVFAVLVINLHRRMIRPLWPMALLPRNPKAKCRWRCHGLPFWWWAFYLQKGLTNERNMMVETPSLTPTEMLNLEQVVFKMESKDYVPQDAILFARICLVPDLTHGRFIILFAFNILVCTRFYCPQTSKRACQWKGKTPLFDRFFQVDTCNFD